MDSKDKRLFGSMLLVAAVTLGGCGGPAPSEEGSDSAASADARLALLVPAGATLERVADLPRDPLEEGIHPDPYTAEQIRLGYLISRDPQTYAPEFVGNQMSCSNCHLNGGQREKALPLVGVAGTFPQYLPRDDKLVSLQARIGGCFRRSMNGTAPPNDHPAMLALEAYINWLSQGQPTGVEPPWSGENELAREARLPIAELDVKKGESLYMVHCLACHGLDGQGINLGLAKPGPLWGPQSWNDGAGAARIWTLAGYIRYAMPLTAPGSLTDEESQHISAFVNSHDRPVYPTKAVDYASGNRPQDAVYDTLVFPTHPLKGPR